MSSNHYLVPDYILKFKCSMCAKCCADWNVTIDKQTMAYYEQIAQDDKVFGCEFKNNIRKNEDGTGKIIFIKPDNQNNLQKPICPFLTEKNLCSIQLRYGVESLPDVAKIYPRIVVLTERGFEISMDYSCPTASELLKEKTPVKFCKDPEGFDFVSLRSKHRTIGNLSERKEDGKASYFQLEQILINIIQMREADIDQRLTLLGIVLDRISNDYINGMDTCLKGLNQEFINQMEAVQISPEIMMSVVKKAIDRRLSLQQSCGNEMQEIFNTAYVKPGLLNDAAKGLDIFLSGYNKLYKPFEKDIQHIYENYFVNYVFSKRFYFYAYKDAYFIMAVFYALTRFFTICRCIDEGHTVTGDMLIESIRTFEHSFGHLNGYYEDLFDLFNNENLINLPYILSFINLSKDYEINTLPNLFLRDNADMSY